MRGHGGTKDEHIGLFAPAERTEGHQRLYNERDVRRLYRIRAPRARAAARSVQERLRAFAGVARETLDALACLRRLEPPENLAGWDPELMRYLDQALATLHETEEEPC